MIKLWRETINECDIIVDPIVDPSSRAEWMFGATTRRVNLKTVNGLRE